MAKKNSSADFIPRREQNKMNLYFTALKTRWECLMFLSAKQNKYNMQEHPQRVL